LSAAFVLEWVFLAFNVQSREDWLLENLLVFILSGPIVWLFLKGHLSLTSYALVILFSSLHCIGAHYTYSLVPYDSWVQDLLGVSLNSGLGWQRNHYDRLLHFLWGFLFFKPLSEFLNFSARLQGRPLVVFTFFTLIVGSTFYELIEWVAAIVLGGDLGVAYVGAQGDAWDAQKDQALAIFGSVCALICRSWFNRGRRV
jgi:putative membrane protein